MVHIHNGILLSYKKESFESVLMKWMNQEPIIQNEVSQKEKDKYCILIHIYGKSHGRGGLCHGVAKSRTRLSDWTELNEVDEPRAYCTEWSKSERERQILYINACVWNLERWYWWTHLQGSSRDADIENRLVDTVGEGEGGMNWESSEETYTLPYVKQIDSGNLLCATGSLI